MFGFGKKRAPVGASEKIEIARQMRAAGRFNVNQAGGGGGDVRYPSQTIPITIIFVIATILAAVLTEGGGSNPLSGMHLTGIAPVDSFVTGSDLTSFTGDADQDKVLTIMGRGMAFFILAGIVPFITFVLERFFFRKTVMPLVLCWAVSTVVLLLYLCWDSIASLLKSL
jgi:hypothetical protein